MATLDETIMAEKYHVTDFNYTAGTFYKQQSFRISQMFILMSININQYIFIPP